MVGELRETCGSCGYRRLCAFAPVKLQIDRATKKGSRHRHEPMLKKGLKRLVQIEGDWERGLITMLAGREKDALLAACLLAEAWRKRPERLHELIVYTGDRCDVDGLKEMVGQRPSTDETALQPGMGIDPDKLQTRMFRGQVLRLASFFRDGDVLKAMQDLLVLDGDDEGRLFQYEAVSALALLIGRKMAPGKWIRGLESDAKGPFRATFATRDPGNGGLDAFFPYRRGKRRSYLYYRRDGAGNQRLSSIDKIRVDSLMHRIFLVFEGDAMKTHRVFKELCRHINVRAGEYNVNHVLDGFDRLDRDDLLLLGIYAPALARAVGHFLGIDSYHKLVKFLYALRSESGRRGGSKTPAHEKVVSSRDGWQAIIDDLGTDLIKSVFTVLFRLNASYTKRIYTTPTYLKIGEVAYLLTALAGWNPKGLEIELKQARKPLAFVAYGLQPPGKWSKIRVGKMRRAQDRLLDSGRESLERAVEQGMRYMALLHGYDSFDDLEADTRGEEWEAPTAASARLPAAIEVDEEDFSEFEDSQDSGIDEFEEGEELFVVVDDHETDETGRLRTQRMKKAEQPSDWGMASDDDAADDESISLDDLFDEE